MGLFVTLNTATLCIQCHYAEYRYDECRELLIVMLKAGNTKGGSITVPLTSCLTGLDSSVLQMETKIVSCHTADSKPVKQEVNGTVILPPLVFPAEGHYAECRYAKYCYDECRD
jgi:hypothetical protein